MIQGLSHSISQENNQPLFMKGGACLSRVICTLTGLRGKPAYQQHGLLLICWNQSWKVESFVLRQTVTKGWNPECNSSYSLSISGCSGGEDHIIFRMVLWSLVVHFWTWRQCRDEISEGVHIACHSALQILSYNFVICIFLLIREVVFNPDCSVNM